MHRYRSLTNINPSGMNQPCLIISSQLWLLSLFFFLHASLTWATRIFPHPFLVGKCFLFHVRLYGWKFMAQQSSRFKHGFFRGSGVYYGFFHALRFKWKFLRTRTVYIDLKPWKNPYKNLEKTLNREKNPWILLGHKLSAYMARGNYFPPSKSFTIEIS